MDHAANALFEQASYLDPADASLFGGSGKNDNNANSHTHPNGAALSLHDDGVWEDSLLTTEPIGKRDWLAKPYLMRGNITSLFGSTSLGKSTVALAWACLLALNSSKVPSRSWGKFESPGGLRVLVYGLEEDQREQRRRIMALLTQWGATIEDLEGRLVILGCTKVGTLIELEPKTSSIRRTAVMDRLKAKIESFRPDVLVLDPMSELHSLEENSNTLQRLVTAEIRTLARLSNLAVLLVAHSPKGNVEPGNIAALRGAGAIGAAIRFGYTVCGMSEDEAKSFGLDAKERDWYLRLDKAKGNYSAPARGATWFKRSEVRLEDEEVGIIMAWDPPEITRPDEALIDHIIEGIARGYQPGIPWSAKLSKDDRSVKKLFERLGIMVGESQKLALQTVLTRGVCVVRFRNSNRNESLGLRTAEGRPSANWMDPGRQRSAGGQEV